MMADTQADPRVTEQEAWEIVLANRGLIVETVNQFFQGLTFGHTITETEVREHLETAASIGAFNAVRRFDPSRGYQLSTYMVPAIRNEMSKAFRELLAQRGGSKSHGDYRVYGHEESLEAYKTLDEDGQERVPPKLVSEDFSDTVLEQIDGDRSAAEIRQIVAGVPGTEGECLRLRYWQNRTYREIGAAFERSDEWARQQVLEAEEYIRFQLQARRDHL